MAGAGPGGLGIDVDASALAVGEVHAVVRPRGEGKTGSLRALAHDARRAGLRIGWGAAWPDQDPPPLWHWRPVLRAVGSSVTGGDRTDLVTAAEAVITALESSALDLVLLDDVDHADPASLVVLEALIRQLPAIPVRLVLSATDVAILQRVGAFPPVAWGAPPSAHRSTPAGSDEASLRRQGDYWAVSRGASVAMIGHRRGLDYLAALLRRPGEEVHVSELAADVVGGQGVATLDTRALAACRQEWAALTADLDEAETNHDSAKAAMLRHRLGRLEASLSEAVGRNGRPRRIGDPAERARVNVTRALRSAIAQIEQADRVLGRHLDAAVRTGTFCSYRPDPAARLAWTVAER